MEKKKISLKSTVIYTMLIIILIFVILTARKVLILATLNKKFIESNNDKNIKIITTFNYSNISKIETLETLDIKKQTIFYNDTSKQTITYVYSNEAKTFTISTSEKTAKIYKNINVENRILPVLKNPAHYKKILELYFYSIITHISTDFVQDRECYVLSGPWNPNFENEENQSKIIVYVDKETGLVLKEVYELSGKEKKTVDYEYSYDKLTDDDFKEPNIDEYILL